MILIILSIICGIISYFSWGGDFGLMWAIFALGFFISWFMKETDKWFEE